MLYVHSIIALLGLVSIAIVKGITSREVWVEKEKEKASHAPIGSDSSSPFFWKKPEYARWLASTLNWGTLSTTSTRTSMIGQAFGNPYSFSDGTTDNSTGIPYFLASTYDQSMHDIFDLDNNGANPNKRVSLTLTEAQMNPIGNWNEPGVHACSISSGGDPENPPCSRLVLSGVYVDLTGSAEEAEARKAFLAKHPMGMEWQTFSDFFYGKIEVDDVWFLDIYGGASVVNPVDYFAVDMGSVRGKEKEKEKE